MIDHVVLFAVRPETPEDRIERMLAAVRALASLPGVVSLSIGPTFTDRGRQYTHGLVARMESREALAAYSAHPAHVAVVEQQIRPIVDGVLALDWDVTS